MRKIYISKDRKLIPSLLGEFYVNATGELFAGRDKITLKEFNEKTNLDIPDIDILVAVTFHKFHWGPTYWKHLTVLKDVSGSSSPENMLLAIDQPVESKTHPEFYLIPYHGGYLISRCGRLINLGSGQEMVASKGPLGYWTFRVRSDDGRIGNRLRHRLLAYAFKKYSFDVVDMDVNHINGVPGDDWVDNLEWADRSGNMEHAYALGLRKDNNPVQIKDINTGQILSFSSQSRAGRVFNVTETTIGSRCKSDGVRNFGGYQYRFDQGDKAWPELPEDEGGYLVEFPDGGKKFCNSLEAAKLVGVTQTSLFRLLREGREFGKTENRVRRLKNKSIR